MVHRVVASFCFHHAIPPSGPGYLCRASLRLSAQALRRYPECVGMAQEKWLTWQSAACARSAAVVHHACVRNASACRGRQRAEIVFMRSVRAAEFAAQVRAAR